MLAQGGEDINLDNLVAFLEANGFYPRRDDLESILRRCDHDANQNINFEEFVEISSGRPVGKSTDDFDHKSSSPNRKTMKNEIKTTQVKKSNSRSDIYNEELDQTYDRL
jgi:hypothetical protein